MAGVILIQSFSKSFDILYHGILDVYTRNSYFHEISRKVIRINPKRVKEHSRGE